MGKITDKSISFETKQENRFLIYMEDIPSFVMKAIKRPNVKVLDNKYVWDVLEITFYDPIDPSTSKKMYSFIENNKIHFDQIRVDCLSPAGDVIESWTYKGCDVIDIEFCKLDWSGKDPSTIKVKFNVDKILLN